MDDQYIIDYAIVANEGVPGLIADVKGSLPNGWQPIGSISLLLGMYCQAIVKYGKREDVPAKPIEG